MLAQSNTVPYGSSVMQGTSVAGPPLPPYPLEDRIRELFAALSNTMVAPTGIDRAYYLDLAEALVRPALAWQQPDGSVCSSITGTETATLTARFTGAIGRLIRAGRLQAHAPACAAAMDVCCAELERGFHRDGTPVRGLEFYAQELVPAYHALQPAVSLQRLRRWREQLAGFDPWERYQSCREMWDHNFPVYAVCGEQLKTEAGIADSAAFIDWVLDNQMKLLTPYGMYRDPHDPMTYDLTCRRQFLVMLRHGYRGRHRDALSELTRRGALTQLLYTSVTGQMPYGGRSNQYHIMEGMACVIAELMASRFSAAGLYVYAGAFKRAARLAALGVAPTILGARPPRAGKNRYPPAARHGDEAYSGSPYAAYSLLAAGLFAAAYSYADETVPESPCPTDRGGYVVMLWPAFHRLWATCAGYHLQLDARGEASRDATGLGRLHRVGVPPETGLSVPMVRRPALHFSMDASTRDVAIGPTIRWGTKDVPFAEWGDGVLDVELSVGEETTTRVAFTIRYRGDLPGVEWICGRYELTAGGLVVRWTSDRGVLSGITVPLLCTDGLVESRIFRCSDGFIVAYEGASFVARAEEAADLHLVLDREPVPNANGAYRVARFLGPVDGVGFRLRLAGPKHLR